MPPSDYLRPSWWLGRLMAGGPGGRLARGTGTAFAISVAGTAVVFLNQVLLANVLGADAYGRYAYAVTWVGLLGIVSVAGLNAAAIRFVAEYRGRGEEGLLKGFLRWSRRVVLFTSTATAGCLALTVWALRPVLHPDLVRVFLVGAALIPLWVAVEVRSASLRGSKRIGWGQGPPQVLRPLLFGLGVLGAYFLRSAEMDAALAMWVNIGATVVALFALGLAERKTFSSGPDPAAETRGSEWLRVALPLLLMAGFEIILRSTDTIMLGAFWGTTQAGTYVVASRAAAFVPFMLLAVNTMAAPMISEYHTTGNREALQRVLTVGARVSALFGAVVGSFLILAGRPLLGLFGLEFVTAYVPMVILVAGHLVNVMAGSVAVILTMTGRQRKAAWALGASALSNVGLNALLVPAFGAGGAAVATTASITVWTALALVIVRRDLGLHPSAIPRLMNL